MSKKNQGKHRLFLWRQNPHCYWCGVLTVWHDAPGRQPADAATLDHVRSRYVPTRAQQSGRWRSGIIVLACVKCNNDRARMEAEFLAKENPGELHRRSGSPPAAKSLLATQAKLATVAMRYVERGGTVDGDKIGRTLRGLAAKLRREYDVKRKKFRESVACP